MATLDELIKEKKRVDRELDLARNREIKGVVKRILPAIAKYGITPDMLFPRTSRKKSSTKVAAKKGKVLSGKMGTKPPVYKDPETGKTWSGYGHEPGWLKGKKREDFLIKK